MNPVVLTFIVNFCECTAIRSNHLVSNGIMSLVGLSEHLRAEELNKTGDTTSSSVTDDYDEDDKDDNEDDIKEEMSSKNLDSINGRPERGVRGGKLQVATSPTTMESAADDKKVHKMEKKISENSGTDDGGGTSNDDDNDAGQAMTTAMAAMMFDVNINEAVGGGGGQEAAAMAEKIDPKNSSPVLLIQGTAAEQIIMAVNEFGIYVKALGDEHCCEYSIV